MVRGKVTWKDGQGPPLFYYYTTARGAQKAASRIVGVRPSTTSARLNPKTLVGCRSASARGRGAPIHARVWGTLGATCTCAASPRRRCVRRGEGATPHGENPPPPSPPPPAERHPRPSIRHRYRQTTERTHSSAEGELARRRRALRRHPSTFTFTPTPTPASTSTSTSHGGGGSAVQAPHHAVSRQEPYD